MDTSRVASLDRVLMSCVSSSHVLLACVLCCVTPWRQWNYFFLIMCHVSSIDHFVIMIMVLLHNTSSLASVSLLWSLTSWGTRRVRSHETPHQQILTPDLCDARTWSLRSHAPAFMWLTCCGNSSLAWVCSASGLRTHRIASRHSSCLLPVCGFFFEKTLLQDINTRVDRTHRVMNARRDVNAPRLSPTPKRVSVLRPQKGLKKWPLFQSCKITLFNTSYTSSSHHHIIITSSTHHINIIKSSTHVKIIKNGRFLGSSKRGQKWLFLGSF
jgi:hypothetical protein